MKSILENCSSMEPIAYEAGEALLGHKAESDSLFILLEGAVEVHRNDVTIAFVTDPGAVFGEMSALLEIPHTASVRAAMRSKIYVIPKARTYLQDHPEFLFPISCLLAKRLKNSTDYLVDLKQQFADQANHLGMVDEVLDSLVHQQDDDFIPAEELPPDP